MIKCIFCEIAAGNMPCHTIYEDDQIMAILDHRPIHPGHTLIIPKTHVDYLMNASDELASHIVLTGNRIARKMMDVLYPKPLTVGNVIHGYVPHLHYHVIPQYDWNDITSQHAAFVENGEVKFDSERITEAEEEKQVSMTRKLKL